MKVSPEATDRQREAAFEQGVAQHRSGRLSEARACYEAVLRSDPAHFDALHLLGVLYIDAGHAEVGVPLVQRAVAIDDAAAPARSNLGKGLNDLGRHADALASLDAAVALEPGFAQAHNNRGLALHGLKRHDEALVSFETAITLQPRLAAAHNNRGLALQALGRRDDALASYDKAIESYPAFAEAHNNRAILLNDLGQSDASLASCEAAIALRPNYGNAHYNRAVALIALERREDALASLEAAIALGAASAEAHHSRGALLTAMDRPLEALPSYDAAIALRPDHAEVHDHRGAALHRLGRLDEALASYRRALDLDPANVSAHCNRALALDALGRLDEALENYDRALALEPGRAGIHNCRGIVLQRLQRAEDALASYETATRLDPDQASHHVNRGLVLHQLRRFDDALEAFDTAIALHAEPANAHFARSLTVLSRGHLREGFEEYRWRWQRTDGLQAMPELPFPPWEGEDLAGKSILVHCEQGFGDSLQFIRYVRPLAAMAARVTVVAQPALVSLFESIAGVEFQADFDARPHEYHAPLMCLPRLFATTLESIPAEVPYLHPDPAKVERWARRLAAFTAPLKIGLVWAGSARKHNPNSNAIDARRSMSLSLFAPLSAIAGVEFFSLQKGEPAARADNPADGVRLIDWTAEFEDFSDTAALIANLDLVIAVDTSVAHLAGALGRPVWILSRHDGCWRWLNGRKDSPWYPTARLFHQKAPGAWKEVIERVAGELERVASESVGAGR